MSSHYILPKIPFLIHKYIDIIENEDVPEAIISNSLSQYLYEIKEKIETRDKDWDIFKKYTNPYEYVDSQIPYKKKSISKAKPLSRSYYKMIEIIQTFKLVNESHPIHSFHLAEGPGGFIEALATSRKNTDDVYIGMTLLDDKNDHNIPGWKKTQIFLKQNPNVYIEGGVDNTGNMLSLENLLGCRESYASSMDFITADGGFDFSVDFNKQEISISQLLFAQVCYAVTMQKKGGSFVLKIFDCFMQHTLDILCILSSFYDKVFVMKPNTSRYANSERYIVCKGFLFPSCDGFFPFLHRAFEKMLMPNSTKTVKYIHRFLNTHIPLCFINKVEEYNAILGQQQLENIHNTILLIDNRHHSDKIDSLLQTNVQKCMQWCVKHGQTHNIIVMNTNVFLSVT
jgi:23S rRNA U2552 (ribose-2'-O)-methylase RlmE/FtsJ